MNEGKDLRNKLIINNGVFYSVGGNNCAAEKFILKKNDWKYIQSYNRYVIDNLDSWCCALSFDNIV